MPINQSNDNPQDNANGDSQKVGFKKPDANQNVAQPDEVWKKVESVVAAAKDAYVSGQSDFRSVIEGMVATLQELLASEEGGDQLGGLGIGGPQMDLPAGQGEPASDQQQ